MSALLPFLVLPVAWIATRDHLDTITAHYRRWAGVDTDASFVDAQRRGWV